MSRSSEKVKKWRKKCKTMIISALGGACCICGYNKCDWVLACHHLDPNEKDFALSNIRANPKSWIKIIDELKKCILVCHNCHTEIHYGLISPPLNAPRFNEADDIFLSLKKEKQNEIIIRENKKKESYSPCLICGVLKKKYKKFCSLKCCGLSKSKIDWSAIDLVKEWETKTLAQISKDIGVSDSAVSKRLIKLGLKQKSNRKKQIK